MCYHRFMNICELFQAELKRKLLRGVMSLDFINRPCNCGKKSTVTSNCVYGNRCRNACIIYKVMCTETNRFYIGNTQQYYKAHMAGHYQDVQNLVRNSQTSDSFAKHFA